MTTGQISIAILLGLAVLTCWLCALGVLVMHGVFDKLHYLSPASLVAGALLLAAVAIERGFSPDTGKVLLTVGLLWVSNPILTFATARAAFVRNSRQMNTEPEKDP